MAKLYVDENFPVEVVTILQDLGHDVLTALVDGKANQGIPDSDVFTRAVALDRAILTYNRGDFIVLHKQSSNHKGIIVCTFDDNSNALAKRIHDALQNQENLDGQLIRINRPNPS